MQPDPPRWRAQSCTGDNSRMHRIDFGMSDPPTKKQRREDYRIALVNHDNRTSAPKLPKKKNYRQRAHANPFSDHVLTYPSTPGAMDWSEHFPAFIGQKRDVEIADVGCGFGGLLFALAPRFPDTLILGMELRASVSEFVEEKIRAMRQQTHQPSSSLTSPEETFTTGIPGNYDNISCLRTNSMKFLPNYFKRGQLAKLFLCFPDPHFKARKHKARIVSQTLTAEYAFVMRQGGLLYTITDVEDLHEWIVGHFASCELFERLSEEESREDVCVGIMSEETEEGKKVERNKGKKFIACFRRLDNPAWA